MHRDFCNFPFRDTTLSTEDRVNDLVSRMTLKEKAISFLYTAPAIQTGNTLL
jgi:beta-glucosidase